jgi:TonB family protein
MSRGDHTFAISMAASVVLHACIAMSLLRQEPAAPLAPTSAPPVAPAASIFIDDNPDASLEFGTADGAGIAANERPGDQPLAAPQADQAQAFLSRDPVGAGSVGDDPSMSVLPRTVAQAAPAQQFAALGAAPPAMQLIAPNRTGTDDTPLVRVKNSPVPMSNIPQQADGAIGSNLPPADPAVMSDSESDPFTPNMTVEFRDGALQARLGRKVKTVRPKLTITARIDLMSMNAPTMTVRLAVDAKGEVRKVDIIRSSGSVGADQAVKVALYQWWIEPKRDDNGRAVASVLTFPIVWK